MRTVNADQGTGCSFTSPTAVQQPTFCVLAPCSLGALDFKKIMIRAEERGNGGIDPDDRSGVKAYFAEGGVFTVNMVQLMNLHNASVATLAHFEGLAGSVLVPSRSSLK